MSSPEVERFEMSDRDYDQMIDPTNFNRRHQTKNQATYGIWAENESDGSGDEMAGLGSQRRPAANKGMSASGISFVSGGFKEEETKKIDPNKDPMEVESWIDKRNKKEMPMPRYVKGHQSNEDRQFGAWEKHTRGIGMKILQKMGHKPGQGLGKTGQGITTPVEAVKRKGKGAIAYHGTERSERSLVDFPVKDKEEEEEKEFKRQLGQWKKQPVEGKTQKPKYIYKTAQEVLDTGTVGKQRRKAVESGPKVKVIDMTGKEQRVLSGYHAIGKSHDKPDEEEDLVVEAAPKEQIFSMPELMHNLNLLVEMAEDDIINNDRQLHRDQDHLVALQHEQERLDVVVQQEGQHIERLQQVVDLVVSCEERSKPDSADPLTLDSCAGIFKMLQQDYYEEYKLYDLSSIAVALVFPLMKTFFTGWLPLKDPDFGLHTVMEWQLLLGADFSSGDTSTMSSIDVYHKLIWDVWIPPVRVTILSWSVRDTDPMVSLLDTWSPALPKWVTENILDQLVLPRLLQEVENWNPLTDTMPIHCWLHPWLPLMGDKLEPLYAPIRHKIANALSNWHPSDASAKIILEPWVGIFKAGHMSGFLMKNILPKLELEIQNMTVNPHHQVLDPWRWVMSWKELLPIQGMVNMLERAFFPKWHQVLLAWLANMPNYQDITKWYLGWKGQFSEMILGHPFIKDQFNKALEVMNRAVSGNYMPGMKENMAYFTHMERRNMEMKAPPTEEISRTRESEAPPSRMTSSGPAPTTFKDLVERRAETEDMLYMPLPGKSQEGKQVYRFGKAIIYFDNHVVFMQDKEGRWLPKSLQALVDAAK